MKSPAAPVLKDLVLIGGGHSHLEVLRHFAMAPIAGVRLTLIARDVHTPYSGMLPGYVAGHYDFDDIHIDLRPLAGWAGARLYHDTVTGLDPIARTIRCAGRPSVSYDLLSINIGSTPRLDDIQGAVEHGVAVKPINRFAERWRQFLDRVLGEPGARDIGVVGAGAAGVELVLAIQHRLRGELAERGRDPDEARFHLISSTDHILTDFPAAVRHRFTCLLAYRAITLHPGSAATAMVPGQLTLADGSSVALDEVLFVTQAKAPSWLGEAGLAVDGRGFVQVDDTLRSLSHREIFAAGDISAMVNHPRPKAGVIAVRQGPPLAENLRHALLSQPSQRFAPQKTFLSLISTGDRHAVASRGPFSLAGRWLWRWKDRIDRDFVEKYTELPEMSARRSAPAIDPALMLGETPPDLDMRCGGCGAKVGADILARVLAEVTITRKAEVMLGLDAPDDAAVLKVPPGKQLVQSVDHFRSFLDDPYLFGKIAANHALGDLYAMGAEPHSALAIASVPPAAEEKVEASLREMLTGAVEVLDQAGAALVGGHTGEAAELALGFSVNGVANPEHLMRKGGMKPGDALILSKPLGTGALFAADMRLKARGTWIDQAIQVMLISNRAASEILRAHGANACTDVTGFGLLGHLAEMITASATSVELDLPALPALDGVVDVMARGIVSSLHPDNQKRARLITNWDAVMHDPRAPLLFDPQTAGGLLASVPADRAEACIAALHAAGYPRAAVIGWVQKAAMSTGVITVSV